MKEFLIFTLLLIIFSFFMTIIQNSGKKMGGAISPAKSLWLFYCIYCWFLLMPFVLYQNLVPEPLNTIWIGFVGWMYFRGMVEMFMMFYTKNWTPPLGIGHNLSCLAWLLLSSIYNYSELKEQPLPHLIFHTGLIWGLIMETYYAVKFYEIIGQNTKGKEAIWYANKDNPVFKKVVTITAIFNIPLYACLIFFTVSLAFS